MVKEFCIQYRMYTDDEKQCDDNNELVTIKIKNGDEISKKEILEYKSYEYASMLQELGYHQVYLKEYIDYDIETQEKRVKQAEKELKSAKELLERKKEYAKMSYYHNLCDWFWGD